MKFPRPQIVPLVIACALFMEQVDGSIIATAVPAISRSLGTDPLHLNLAITSYLFSLAIFIPLSGWVADRFGARTVFCSAIGVFMLGSVACGLSQNLGELVAARTLQGAGGAMMVPVGRLVLLRTVPKAKLVDAMAWFTAPALVGPVLGPPIGGLIVTYASWRWIFFVNVPISIAGYLLARKYVANIRETRKEPLDLRGFFLAALALTGLVFCFETVGRHLVPWHMTLAGLLFGLSAAIVYYLHYKRQRAPIIDLGMLRFPTFRASMAGGSLFRIAIGALPFLLPLMLQYGYGLSPAMSGFVTLATATGAMLMKIIAKPILRALGFRNVLIWNVGFNALFLAGIVAFDARASWGALFIFLLLGGLFRSLQFTALNTFAFADVPERLMSRANTFYIMMQQLMLSLGVAAGAMILNVTLYLHQDTELKAAYFTPAFLLLAVMCLFSVVSYLPLPHNAGEELSGNKLAPEQGRHEA